MHRNTPAVLAALLCLVVGPALYAARPTRPVRPARHAVSGEPRLSASHARGERRSISAAARRRPAVSASRRTLFRRSTGATHTPATAHSSSRGGKSRSIAPEDSSFLARSARAAAERRARQKKVAADSDSDSTDLRTSLADADGALLPASHPFSLYNERGRLIVPAPLRGSHEVLLHQNEMADDEGLSRIQDDADLDELRSAKQLVPLPTGDALRVDERLPDDRRYSRPWTATFLSALSRDYYAKFHAPLQVDSAVRTVSVQKRLERTNGNAAPAEGETASPHLTGQAVDIAKRGLTRVEIAWLRLYLQPLMAAGSIDVEEEFRQACFHISVYRSYMPKLTSQLSVPTAANPSDTQP